MTRLVRRLTRWTVVVGMAAAGLAIPQAAHAASCAHVTIQSTWSLYFTSVEIGETGFRYAMLRARASKVGPWEKFTACYNESGNYYTFRSEANGKYVVVQSSNGDYAWMLTATAAQATAVSAQFREINPSSDTPSLLALRNDNYVSTELGYKDADLGLLRARATSIGPWEQFAVHVLSFV
jgi:hypothetical protein